MSVFDGLSGEWADRMFSEQLAEALAAIEGGLWAEYGKARKPISKNQLAQLLKGFKIVPVQVRIGTKSLKGYYRHQFEDVWDRYLAPQRVCETKQRNNPTAAGTSAAFPNETGKSDVSFQKREKPLRPSNCFDVSFRKEGNGLPNNDAILGELIARGFNCAHCRGGPVTGNDPPTMKFKNGSSEVWVHPECQPFWFQSQLPEKYSPK
jgi:uncharacterized protein DUF3631